MVAFVSATSSTLESSENGAPSIPLNITSKSTSVPAGASTTVEIVVYTFTAPATSFAMYFPVWG